MLKRIIASIICVAFSFTNLQYLQAQDFSVNQLPVPGVMVGISSPFAPLALKGLIVNPKKPLEFQFIVDTGHGAQDIASIKDQSNQLVKYFLAGLTIPEGELWVNLSPYEKDRMLPQALGQTDLGRDLLAQDYVLKQLTASLIYPEKDLGKEFWNRVYAKAQEQFGTTNVPVNTFNKVWILPNEAQVFEHGAAAYVTKSTLKVMLDEDYLALSHHVIPMQEGINNKNHINMLGSQIVRQIILPEIEKEVNTGKNFAPLRQIYQAMILAKWYKETIQNGLLDAVYTNKKKMAGINLEDPAVKEQIYERYLKAYKKGAFNYIKEDAMPDGQMMPRKYFSGGMQPMPRRLDRNGKAAMIAPADGAMMAVVVDLLQQLLNNRTILIEGTSVVAGTLLFGPTLVKGTKAIYSGINNGLLKFKDNEFGEDYKPSDVIKDLEDRGIPVPYLEMSIGKYESLLKDKYFYKRMSVWPPKSHPYLSKIQAGKELTASERKNLLNILLYANDYLGTPVQRLNNLSSHVRELSRSLRIKPEGYQAEDKQKVERAERLVERLRNAEDLNSGDRMWLTRFLLESYTKIPRKILSPEPAVVEQKPALVLVKSGKVPSEPAPPSRLILQAKPIQRKVAPVLIGGMTTLMAATLGNRLDDMRQILLAGEVDINARDNEGFTALMYAAKNGWYEAVNLLLDNGADINAVTPHGQTALAMAKSSFNGSNAIVSRLETDVNLRDENGRTQLIRAIVNHNTDLAIDLLNRTVINVHGESVRIVNVNVMDVYGMTPLLVAIKNGYEVIEDLLRERGAVIDVRNDIGETSLMILSKRGIIPDLRLLLKLGADVNSADKNGVTSLMLASLNDYYDVADLLLSYQAEVNVATGGKTGPTFRVYKSAQFGYQYLRAYEDAPERRADIFLKRAPIVVTPLSLVRFTNSGNSRSFTRLLNNHRHASAAMVVNSRAKNTADKATLSYGGIDLNQIKIHRTGKVIDVQFDQAQLAEILRGDFGGFSPVITSVTVIKSPLPLMGVNPLLTK